MDPVVAGPLENFPRQRTFASARILFSEDRRMSSLKSSLTLAKVS
jgi:hypothetical protein